MTRHSTRKVEQLRRNPKGTLFFDDDGYASFFWPRFPHDFVMLEIQPHWIEFMGPGIPNHAKHWRPQGLDLGPVTNSRGASDPTNPPSMRA